MPRKFKSGDWVKVRGKLTAPKMQVLKYVTRKDSMFGLFEWLFLWSAMVFHMIEHVDMYYMSVAWVVSGGRSGSVVVL